MNSGQFGGGPGQERRYNKGRVPQGVEFSSLPGRAATPLPSSNESRAKERTEQHKIWNAAISEDANKLSNRSKSNQSNGQAANIRRVDDFDGAQERHAQSFAGTSAKQPTATAKDIFENYDESDESDHEALVPILDEPSEAAATLVPPSVNESAAPTKSHPTTKGQEDESKGRPDDKAKGGCCSVQ
mmetsp:Transcript_9137/g.18538  ORF Transcript_9137/g.18538 Transcript_9137/m.18538 type:complete len:186 (+) Transcript_9137:96-653(+)